MKPICVPCKLFYKPEKNGVYFIEGMPTGDGWKPYKIWVGDLWKCKGCGHEIISGVGHRELAIHHQVEFRAVLEGLQPEMQINDC